MRWLAFVAVVFLVAPLARADDTSAAIALHARMSGASGQAKERAQYELATVLYRMGLKQAAYGLFAEITERPTHDRYGETLVWLAKLGVDLPEAADVAERVGKYSDAQIAMLHSDAQRDAFTELEWLSGQYAYRNRNYDDAIARFSRIDRSSQLYGKAQMMAGMSNVQARRSVPAVQAFQRVVSWLDESALPPDALRLRDLANISMARTYFSAAIHVDERGASVVDATGISAAAKYFRRVSPTGELFLDAIFEDAWTRAWAGDDAHALGDARLASSRFAEAGLLEALIQYGACRYDDAASAIARLRATAEPRKRALTDELAALEKTPEDDRWRLAMRSPEATDRKMASYVAYESLLASEKKRFEALPPAFRSSPLGNDVADAIALGTDIVHREIGDLGRERILRAKDELDDVLRSAAKIEIDVVAAKRDALESGAAATPPPPPVRPRTITLSWPINGNHAPDPLYATPITHACP
jgi:tetratricopeptide (TPR) repeat protein